MPQPYRSALGTLCVGAEAWNPEDLTCPDWDKAGKHIFLR